MSFIIGLWLVFIGLGLMVVLQGLRRIPAEPPQVALVTFLGERIGRVKKEGWRFFFIYPYLFGYIPIEVTKTDQDFTPEEVRTPDNADLKVPISVTWSPDAGDPEALIAFLNSGKVAGVKNILEDIVSERIRQWARSPGGPKTWEEAQGAADQAVESILSTILTRDVTDDEMKEIRRGNGKFKLPSLGITISRLNIGQVEVTGAVKEAAEKAAKETQEKKAEDIETSTFLSLVKRNQEEGGFTRDEARDNVQVERGKVPKTISEHRISIDPLAAKAIRALAKSPMAAAAVASLITKKEDKQV